MRFNQAPMYIVIFKAKIKQLDSTYSEMAQKLRNRALSQFNCAKFEACSENGFEIATTFLVIEFCFGLVSTF